MENEVRLRRIIFCIQLHIDFFTFFQVNREIQEPFAWLQMALLQLKWNTTDLKITLQPASGNLPVMNFN